VLRQVYDQMSEPKWVISMGVCASSGGMFNNYAIVQGVDHIVPVAIYLPGCPPRPEMLIDAIVKLHDKIQNTKLGANRNGRSPNWRRPASGGPMSLARKRTRDGRASCPSRQGPDGVGALGCFAASLSALRQLGVRGRLHRVRRGARTPPGRGPDIADQADRLALFFRRETAQLTSLEHPRDFRAAVRAA